MKNYKIGFVCLCTYLCYCCSPSITSKIIKVDLNGSYPLEYVSNYFQFDSIIRIAPERVFISSFDKSIISDSELFVLDKSQNAIFKVDILSKSVHKIIHNVGKAAGEYIEITDFAIDNIRNIYVYDSNTRKVNVYKTDGDYIKSVKVTYGSAVAISNKNDIAINSNQSDDELIYVYSNSGKMLYHVTPDVQAPAQALEELGIVCPWQDGFIYTRPFDFLLYKTDGTNNRLLAQFDFGDYQFDANMLKGIDYKEFQGILRKCADKVMSLSHLSSYEDYLFMSTDRNDQILYNTAIDSAFVFSNIERPYNILFRSLFSVNNEGRFCSIISNDNIIRGYIPAIEANGTKLEQLKITKEKADEDDNVFWLLLGKVK